MEFSASIKEISTALSKLQSQISNADKSSINPHFKSKYSTLEDVWNTLRPHLEKTGLAILQDVTTKESSVSVSTFITHSSGEWIRFGSLDIPFGRKDAHSVGSACSYAKRYSICAAIGIVSGENEDDGNESVTQCNRVSTFTKEQCDSIDELIGEDMELLNRILTGYKVAKLSEISTEHYLPILNTLKKRKQ